MHGHFTSDSSVRSHYFPRSTLSKWPPIPFMGHLEPGLVLSQMVILKGLNSSPPCEVLRNQVNYNQVSNRKGSSLFSASDLVSRTHPQEETD